ncbi:MAG: phosphatidylserine/phosphatidylglycerophosphate/cardiolipin synthase family protein [Gemmatimonadetes bacterium]|nr:phosphatidylserine/phosphatidylglycerophosphate/cardiolipin synthase family protein [Gemmatimonadota bacterium]NNF13680.1 phosphatidylserine/phosphatidylglycerophosphate/cardiolipin synthase family protein [Gemmatimonadota bacterium]NNL30773.1 phosphatidylserine/phosphatidylglycerophosphate/cardiolipin synthase family protein [Gemmatimonadota bacterium]
MKIELLVGADEFWERMREDLVGARDSAYIQTFSFEGDRVGIRLGRALRDSTAKDRRLLVDSYSRLYHSDRVIPGPSWRDRSLRREVKLTHRWIARLREDEVGVRFGNPLGPSPLRLVRRSHKKLAAFDGRVVYLGGINFSDHNFAWHDMMLRVESPELAELAAEDFRSSWEGRPTAFDREVGSLRLISLNGRGNRAGFQPVIEAIDQARYTIDVVSAYLSHPFTDFLARARRRGVRVRVLMPGENNKSNLARHILERAVRGGFEVLRYPGGMSHMKAMTVDGELLVMGSSNFDFMSYHILEEHVVMTRDRALVDAYMDRVWRPDAASAHVEPVRSSIGTRLGDLAVRIGAAVASSLALTQGETT